MINYIYTIINGDNDPENLIRYTDYVLSKLVRIYESIESKYKEGYGRYERIILNANL